MLVEVFEARFVAVVAVGDEDRLRRRSGPDGRVGRLVGDGPEPVDDAEVVGRLQRASGRDGRPRGADHLAVGVGVEAEDGAQVEAGGPEELEPVGLRAGERLLVGIDLGPAERLEPDAGDEALAGVRLALDLEFWW